MKKSDIKKTDLFIELAQPNDKGVSRWVSASEFVGKYHDLKLGNGLSWGRKGKSLERNFIIEVDRSLTPGDNIDRIRLNGFNTESRFNQNIRSDIKKALSSKPCVMLGTFGGTTANMKIEVDHKDGRKEDMRVSDLQTQKLEDFQPLCKAANDFKRQKCKECKETNKRWSASVLEGFEDFPFYDGDENYTKEKGCVGCYLYDPVAYRKAFREFVKNQRG